MLRYLIAVTLCLLAFGCADKREEHAAKIYNMADKHAENREYDKAIALLQRIPIDYEDTSFASQAEEEISQWERLRELHLKNQRDKVSTSFQRIHRALENYKVRFLHYPMTPKDLEKLPAIVIPDWKDVWGNSIHYRPVYSSDTIPKHEPDGFALATFGQDGLPGGDGEDEDHFFKNGKMVDSVLD